MLDQAFSALTCPSCCVLRECLSQAVTEINGSGHVLGGGEVLENAFVQIADDRIFENDLFLSRQHRLDGDTEDTAQDEEEFEVKQEPGS